MPLNCVCIYTYVYYQYVFLYVQYKYMYMDTFVHVQYLKATCNSACVYSLHLHINYNVQGIHNVLYINVQLHYLI